jgi:hypothetical protein
VRVVCVYVCLWCVCVRCVYVCVCGVCVRVCVVCVSVWCVCGVCVCEVCVCVCVCVCILALFIWHANRMRRIAPSPVTCLAVSYFFTASQKTAAFLKKNHC